MFSPDQESDPPEPIVTLAGMIRKSDGLIIASPEYVRSIPGGLNNAIDWLVSREELIHKHIALMHASHRGDDMLAQLRLVLATVSSGFLPEVFLKLELLHIPQPEIETRLSQDKQRHDMENDLNRFSAAIET
ncbi:NAD(P)H-dependent oxidoreductase [Thioclava litoralis]|uniref:NAD(P)H-dependent oxidoreductase n=1 Tax=Thioclava litoralis TaxID=3076557 RepID=A0ABZ1DYY1_9RHOB|nr:NAD(P)H-dependent oxidoreductase [Thioclava sp. FTW29]